MIFSRLLFLLNLLTPILDKTTVYKVQQKNIFHIFHLPR